MKVKKKVFIVDNKSSSELKNMLNGLGYINISSSNINNICNEIRENKPDLILFDFMIFGKGKINLIKEMRKLSNSPILIITNNSEKINIIMSLELGADDYIIKPFDVDELSARIKAINRRYEHNINDGDNIKFNNIEFDMYEYKIRYGDKEVCMSPKEYDLVHYLAKKTDIVVSRKELLREIWNGNMEDSRTLDVHITKLRSKLRKVSNLEIKTVWGKGYKFTINN